MHTTVVAGALLAIAAGLLTGASPWPIKRMRRFQYEHWAFVAMLSGLVLTPWIVTLAGCPDALAHYSKLRFELLKSNLCSLSWGIANVLWLLCFVRIGMSLTNGILVGIGASLGVVAPMVVKGTGFFKDAPEIGSTPGRVVLVGVAVMLLGVILVSVAGLGRERAFAKGERTTSGSFAVGLLMAVLAGILSAGIGFAFVYSQHPIIEAMKSSGAGDIPANVSVWAAGLLAGAALNVVYPAILMTKNRSWHVLWQNPGEIALAVLFGVPFFASFVMMGEGSRLLGGLGGSVGIGLQQIMLMLSGQIVGFLGGEWRGVYGAPRKLMYVAVAVLVLAAAIMLFGNYIFAVMPHGGSLWQLFSPVERT